ncbi:MAG: AI-2E family transporter [Clostridiales bacterium]|nr:AI-2E family transporter [Clostridiales bacterium]
MKFRDKLSRRYLQTSIYVIVTAVIIYSLSLIAKNAPAIMQMIMEKLNWLLQVIKPVILGFVFAYLLDPAATFFEKKYQKIKVYKVFHKFHAPRTWAAVTTVLLVAIAVAGLISLSVYSVTDQLRLANLDDIVKLGNEFVESLNTFYYAVLEKLGELDIQSQQFENYVTTVVTYVLEVTSNLVKNSISSVSNMTSFLTTFFFSFLIGFYFMIDGRMFMKYTKKICFALFNEKKNQQLRGMIEDLDEVFSGYIRGQMLDALFMMATISIVLSAIGVKFSIVIGIFAGIGNLIPYFGPIVAYVSTTLVCLTNGDMRKLLIALIALVIIQAIDGNFVGPRLLSKSIKIHPLIVIISLIFGSAIGGFLGMLLAVPIGAYIKLVFVRFIDNKVAKREKQLQVNGTDNGHQS